jgi:hypothetical protein
MSASNAGTARPRLNRLIIAFALLCGLASSVQAEHPRKKFGPLWGEYGLGPHFHKRGPSDCDLGYPYFTHPMNYGSPYWGPPPNLSGYKAGDPPGHFGAYTGRTPFPDYIAPSLGPQPGDRSADELPARSPRQPGRARGLSGDTR